MPGPNTNKAIRGIDKNGNVLIQAGGFIYDPAAAPSGTYIWGPSGQIAQISPPANRGGMIAMGMNADGIVVGQWRTADTNEFRAFIWQDGVAEDFVNRVPGGNPADFTLASAIADNGRVVGNKRNPTTGLNERVWFAVPNP